MSNNKCNLELKLKPVCFGLLSGIISLLVMLGLSAFVFTQNGGIPNFVLGPLSLIIISLSTFLSGYVSGHVSESKGIIYGSICGIIIFSIIFLFGIIINNSTITLNLFLKGILIILFAICGGVLGVNMS